MLHGIEARLIAQNADLFSEPDAYREGVEDAITEVEAALGDEAQGPSD